jgi:hypothetical protein
LVGQGRADIYDRVEVAAQPEQVKQDLNSLEQDVNVSISKQDVSVEVSPESVPRNKLLDLKHMQFPQAEDSFDGLGNVSIDAFQELDSVGFSSPFRFDVTPHFNRMGDPSPLSNSVNYTPANSSSHSKPIVLFDSPAGQQPSVPFFGISDLLSPITSNTQHNIAATTDKTTSDTFNELLEDVITLTETMSRRAVKDKLSDEVTESLTSESRSEAQETTDDEATMASEWNHVALTSVLCKPFADSDFSTKEGLKPLVPEPTAEPLDITSLKRYTLPPVSVQIDIMESVITCLPRSKR